MFAQLVNWFVPGEGSANRTDHELTSVFVFTHICGPFLAQPMWIYLILITPGLDWSVAVLMLATACFWALPFLLKYTGNMGLATLLSFQLLATTTLFAAKSYGGFSSPFMPWLIVSLLLGLFYHSRNAEKIIAAFCANLLVWVVFLDLGQTDSRINVDQLVILGALSFASATIYVTWMAHYYSRIVGLRAELEMEAERCNTVFAELQEARACSEHAISLRARFFSKISHELRTPLNAIIGYADLLMEDLREQEPNNTRQLKDISRIMAAARHLMSLFSQVLDVKAIEEQEQQLEITDFTLGDLCDDVTATCSHLVEKNQNRLIIICPRRAEILSTDATRLRQVLLNLLSNAAKFTVDGVIKLEIDLLSEKDQGIFKATVIDTGIGMSEEGLSKIFSEYEQAESTTCQKYGGTGIGLPISRQICHLLGGEITAASRPGQGSCFTVWIPARYSDVNPKGAVEESFGKGATDNLPSARAESPRLQGKAA